ncbi:MAG: hypothetical protein ACD_54C00695G0001 [uncultured bacterium]|nr:MAG: hypothetical protein ACD_54C00695G0001 [uncultured bacterium]
MISGVADPASSAMPQRLSRVMPTMIRQTNVSTTIDHAMTKRGPKCLSNRPPTQDASIAVTPPRMPNTPICVIDQSSTFEA